MQKKIMLFDENVFYRVVSVVTKCEFWTKKKIIDRVVIWKKVTVGVVLVVEEC